MKEIILVLLATCGIAAAAVKEPINSKPAQKDWANLASLPDWTGVWVPNVTWQMAEEKANALPWNDKAAAKIKKMQTDNAAGNPFPLFVNCLPEGMPSWMMVSHNAMEVLFTPGRVTLLGESDGNRLRRIYTDGRDHPQDGDLTFHGHSIGHWEKKTLVIDTVNVHPQSYLAVSESVGVPNNGNMHIVERMHLLENDQNVLIDEIEIQAPKILSKPWKTIRKFHRQRARKFDIVEGTCVEGSFVPQVNKEGDAVFVYRPSDPAGNPAVGN